MNDTISIGVDNNFNKGHSQSSQDVILQKPSSKFSLPKQIPGTNILTGVIGIDNIEKKLMSSGLEIKKILYFDYGNGRKEAVFLFCITIHGQYAIIIPPQGTEVNGGDLGLLPQRVDVLPTSTVQNINSKLTKLYTDHAYICSGGIHLSRDKGNSSLLYGYSDYEMAQVLFGVKKHHYLIVPVIEMNKIIEPVRLNTIEAYINNLDDGGLMSLIIQKTGLESLLTMKGPFTIFMPNDENLNKLMSVDSNQLRAIILAHVIIERLEFKIDVRNNIEGSSDILTNPDRVSTLGSDTKEYTSLAQNKIEVKRINGSIVSVKSTGVNSKVHMDDKQKPVHKYNGILYRINGTFTPINKSFKLPERSDFDDVVTVFDINKSTMEIRIVQYEVNLQKQKESLELISYINDMASVLSKEINENYQEDGIKLLQNSKLLMNLFFSREVPCDELCQEMDDLAEKVKKENLKFENLVRVSTQFSSIKVSLEEMLLKISRIDQKLHVDNIIDRPPYPDDEEDE